MGFSKEIKESVLKDYRQNVKVKDICEKYNVSRACIYNWLNGEQRIKGTEITLSDYNKLKRLLEKKALELEIFENLHCFKDSPTKEKEEAISRFIGVYPIKTMCKLLDIPTGTMYNYHLRRTKVTQYQLRDDYLKQEITRIFKESDGRFGAKKIWIKLKTEGNLVSLNKVQNLMKELDIHSKQRLRKSEHSIKNDNSQYYVNKLKRIFNQDRPNKYWVSDVTELRVKSSKFYLCVILDLFSRKVIAYRLSSQNNTQLTIKTFKDAFEDRNRPEELSFHSDQGCNYTSWEFRELLRVLKVNQSFSNKGNPYDNACMESFFSTFKREEYNGNHYEFFDELEESIKEYMYYYNDYRPHESLKNKTPNQFEIDYYNKKATS